MEIGPENEAGHVLRHLKHVVMVVPVDAYVDKAEDIAQEDGKERPQCREVTAVRDLELQHHDGDDDCEHAVAERFKTSFWHEGPSRQERGRRLTHVESAPLAATIESTKTRGSQQGAALMKRTTKYVALDVHQATTVASVREESGRVIARSVLPTDRGTLTEFVRGMRGARHVTFEEGTQAQWLYDVLAPLVDRVVVCDRRGASRQGHQGDQVDADQLSELLRRGALRAVYHGSADHATLQELTRTYRTLVEDATRGMLRLKALFRARGIPASGKHVYHPRGRAQWLAQLQDPGARLRAEALYAELDVLRHLRPRAKAAMVTEARRGPPWALLPALPVFGSGRAALLP